MKIRAASMLVSFIVLAACATTPPPKPAATASATSAAAGAAAPSPTNRSAPSAKSGGPEAELHNYAHAQGYKSVARNGNQVWCRQEPTLGSHFETVYCLTDAVLADMKRKAQENQQEMIHDYRPNCVGSTCNF